MSVYSVSCLGAALALNSLALATGTGPFAIRYFNNSLGIWQTATDTEAEVTETPSGSNRWTIVFLDTSVNDPGRAWTITGDQTNPGIALFENERPDSILSNPTVVVISDTPDISFNSAMSDPFIGPGCSDFGGLASGTGTENTALVLLASGEVSGDIVLKQLGRLDGGGDVSADIEVTFAGNPIEKVEVGGVFSGSLETAGTSLKSFVSGSYTGDMDLSGDLGRFDVQTGPIPGTLVCDRVSLALNPLAGLSLDNSSTDITLGDDLPSTTITINGDFGGQIRINGDLTANSAIVINGTLLSTGEIDIRGEMLADSEIQVGLLTGTAVEAGGRISIRDELRDDAAIGVFGGFDGAMILDDLEGKVTITGAVGAAGVVQMDGLATGVSNGLFLGGELAGQVIINQQNDGSAWSGFVWVDEDLFHPGVSQPEQAPFYESTSADLGGGAIGLVPYWLHAVDCVPLPGSTPDGSPGSVALSHYGPVLDDSTTGLPFTVEKKPLVQTWPPVDYADVSDDFTATINSRVAEIAPKPFRAGFEGGFYYRIKPTGDLLCGGIAQEVAVLDYTYIIRVFSKADLSMNGVVDEPDPVLWIAGPVDVNEDGVTDTNDLSEIFAQMSD